MEIKTSQTSERVTMTLAGRINTVTAVEFQAAADALPADVKNVDVDFAAVEYIASAGLRVLAAIDERLATAGGKLRVLSPTSAVLEILDMTGFTDMLTVV